MPDSFSEQAICWPLLLVRHCSPTNAIRTLRAIHALSPFAPQFEISIHKERRLTQKQPSVSHAESQEALLHGSISSSFDSSFLTTPESVILLVGRW
jgi:hypothetical protein